MFGLLKPKAPARKRVATAVSARLEANPAITRAAVDDIQFYYHPDFLDRPQCDALIRMIDADRRPSTLLSERADEGFRTSESCDMSRWSPDVRPIDEAIADLLGIAYQNGETMQGQRYAPGQHFRAHHDYFHESEYYWQRMKDEGGQRTWTAMIYLNDVAEGGATWFPSAGIRVAPKRGLLLVWNNMKPDGTPNPMTLHEGMPVEKGVKYIITKWFREASWLAQAGM
ncbi:prolyl hydroxylase family protein [Hephaestia sp. GCM10023244]|uniref:prolyl hydroxylase family protein n=1 Tax=unclassified Hephaestia TaxID=2631281 RepID=UPI002076E269|nr:2OG-Fe(II) oxygenase [Hephaestia sp. MAHUQ-44]MCM8731708.1 2OG-Fe(II) oxygenase [Hephaestia sp. MAHUQ-44]